MKIKAKHENGELKVYKGNDIIPGVSLEIGCPTDCPNMTFSLRKDTASLAISSDEWECIIKVPADKESIVDHIMHA